MNRRSLLKSLAAVTAVPFVAKAETPPEHVRYSHVAFGVRPYGTIGPYVEWRDRTWWIGERGQLQWAFSDRTRTAENQPDFDWIHVVVPLMQLAPDRDKLWMLDARGYWYHLTFHDSPSDDTALVVCAFHG